MKLETSTEWYGEINVQRSSFQPSLTQQHRSDVHVQSLLGSNPHLETWRVETASGLLLPGQEAGPGLDEGLPA